MRIKRPAHLKENVALAFLTLLAISIIMAL
jgi:hypothetical protein